MTTASRRRSFARWVLRFRRDERGATALEFAIAGPMFLVLACVVIELGLILFTQAALDKATRDAARTILIGQVQMAAGSSTPFTTQLCASIGTLIPCASLKYNVQSGSTFAALNATVQTDANGNMTNMQFTPGTAGSRVLVQVGYNRPTLIPWVGRFITGNGSNLLVSTVALQTEPYQ